jgi:hypothetical protein
MVRRERSLPWNIGSLCNTSGIIALSEKHTIMEAERINAIAKQLTDIDNRAAELRRYL